MRQLLFNELAFVSGGDDGCSDGGGGCSPGDTGAGGGAASVGGVTAVADLGTVTVTGFSASQGAQFGALAGSAIGLGAVLTGAVPLTMSLGEAMALGALLGGVAGIASVAIAAAIIALMAQQSGADEVGKGP